MILHVVHDIKIGGVETAIVKYTDSSDCLSNYHVLVLGSNHGLEISNTDKFTFLNSSSYNPVTYFKALAFICKSKPALLVSSLWRSHIVSLMATLVLGKDRVLPFVHNSRFIHIFDCLFTGLILKNSRYGICDSISSMSFSKSINSSLECEVIPFVFQTKKIKDSNRKNKFIFIGRISKQKNLKLAVEFIYRLKTLGCNIEFDIYGTDEGELASVINLITDLNVSELVSYKGSLKPKDVPSVLKQYQFLIQLSDFEGMAMTVVEALQYGTIPIVTPVGEIPSYVSHKKNGILMSSSLDMLCSEFLELTELDIRAMRKNAINTFEHESFYIDCFNKCINSRV